MKQPLSQINTNPFTRTFNGLESLFKYNPLWTIILLVLGAGGVYGRYSSMRDDSQAGGLSETTSIEMTAATVFALSLVTLVAIFIGLVFISYANGIAAYVAWKTSKGEKAGLVEAFSAVTQRFWTIMAVHAWTLVKVIGGLLLLVIPGIRAMLRYQMALFPVFDEELRAKPAMERIKGLTRGHLLEILGITSVGVIIPVVGSVLTLGGETIMYPQLKQLSKYKGDQPKVHWLNYMVPAISLILLAIFMSVFIAFVTGER